MLVNKGTSGFLGVCGFGPGPWTQRPGIVVCVYAHCTNDAFIIFWVFHHWLWLRFSISRTNGDIKPHVCSRCLIWWETKSLNCNACEYWIIFCWHWIQWKSFHIFLHGINREYVLTILYLKRNVYLCYSIFMSNSCFKCYYMPMNSTFGVLLMYLKNTFLFSDAILQHDKWFPLGLLFNNAINLVVLLFWWLLKIETNGFTFHIA